MSFETYHVYFSGQLMKDRDPAEVRKKIGRMFKLEGAKLERLFSGEPVAIKKNVDMEQAVKYRVAFREAGGLVDIRPATATVTPAPAMEAAAKTDAQQGLSLSAPNSYDLSDCAPRVTASELPDISGLNLDRPGVTLDTSPEPEPLVIDTDDWDLDRPGVTLDESAPPPEPAIDTSELTLDPANQGSLEAYQTPVTPVPLPNIDHLDFTETEEKPRRKARFPVSEE